MQKITFKNIFKKGFTLIEVLVITSVITILSFVVVSNYREGEKGFALLGATHKLAQDIREAQEMAMSVRKCCGEIIPPGYGIFLDTDSPNQYILYADMSVNNNQFYTELDDIIETIILEEGVVISEIQTTIPIDIVSINFEPPDPRIDIKKSFDDSAQDKEVIITLALGSRTKTITVNIVGLIDID